MMSRDSAKFCVVMVKDLCRFVGLKTKNRFKNFLSCEIGIFHGKWGIGQ